MYKAFISPWSTLQVPPSLLMKLQGVPGVNGKLPFNVSGLVPCAGAFSLHGQELRWSRLKNKREAPALAPYQEAGLKFALGRRDAALWHVVGAGKTRVFLSWGLLTGERLIYVTRASARRTAEAEVEKWTKVKAQVLVGIDPHVREGLIPSEKRPGKFKKGLVHVEEPLDPDALVYIVGYEVLPYWCEVLANAARGNGWSVVFDEIHHVKSRVRKSGGAGKVFNRAGAAKAISLACARRLGGTGTPIRDRPRDLWAELDLIEPSAWGDNWTFVHRYCDARQSSFGGLDTSGKSNESELRVRLDAVVHRVGYEEVQRDLPPLVESVVRIPVSEQSDPEEARSRLPDSLQGKLPRSIAFASALKLNAVIDLVESQFDGESRATPRKVAVLTFLRRDCEDIAAELSKRFAKAGAKVQVLAAHGGTPPEKRDHLRQQYMESLTEVVLIGTGDAWGEAVNLNDTDVAVMASLPFTPGQITQWRGRFHRKGQKKNVQIIYPIAVDTVDEHVANVLLRKLPAVAQQVDLGGESEAASVLERAIGLNDEEAREILMKKIMEGEE